MTTTLKWISLSVFLGLTLASCDNEEPNNETETSVLSLDISGLEDLGDGYTYEGWIMVDGSPVTTGLFDVSTDGVLSRTSFDIATSDLEKATAFILTVEPSPDPDPAPSDVHILAGDFTSDDASLTIAHPAALNSDFSSAAGTYILATPTDTDETNEDSGIWFLDNSSGAPAVGLDLPELPKGWAYEGWAVIDGNPVSTGTFTQTNVADDAAPFSGENAGPPFPGEDFLVNAPAGLSFPTSLGGGLAVISIEPVPDNSPAPFTLKPLVHNIPENAEVHSALSMGQNLSFPTGSASR